MAQDGDHAAIDRFERSIGIRFLDRDLLRRALTHRSQSRHNNERLEFLGDSVLGLVVTEILYHRFPQVSEGKLSRMRSHCVRKETLAQVAREMGLQRVLLLGEGELKSGGFERDSLLSDCLEAVIAAVYLDRGMQAAEAFVRKYFERILGGLAPDTVYKDPKSRLQEHLQQRGAPVPNYEVISVSGEPHTQIFLVRCTVDSHGLTFEAKGSTRRTAEQTAAKMAYQHLSQNDNG